MEKLHSLIDDLELMADKLPKEANWFGNVDHIRQTIKDMRRALQQAPCSTLRVSISQRLKDIQLQMKFTPMISSFYLELIEHEERYKNALSVIDDMQPVA